MKINDLHQEIHLVTEAFKCNANLRVKWFKVYALEQVTKFFADLITNTAVAVCFLLAFIFGTITLGFFFSELLENYWLGFGCIAVFYIFSALMVFILRYRFIEKSIINFTICKLVDKYLSSDDH
jgi:hypothetical protein